MIETGPFKAVLDVYGFEPKQTESASSDFLRAITVGMHLNQRARISLVVVRMRCWFLMDACSCILCCNVDSICAFRVGHVHRARYTQTNNYQQLHHAITCSGSSSDASSSRLDLS
jgi:hypothetical protein